MWCGCRGGSGGLAVGHEDVRGLLTIAGSGRNPVAGGTMSRNFNGARPDGKNLEDVLDPSKDRTIVRGCSYASQ